MIQVRISYPDNPKLEKDVTSVKTLNFRTQDSKVLSSCPAVAGINSGGCPGPDPGFAGMTAWNLYI